MIEAEAGPVRVERIGRIMIVTIERPEKRNAINRMVAEQLASAFSSLDESPELRVGVLTGAEGTFSAGADMVAAARGERSYVTGRGFAGMTERPPDKPLIAAVEGWALGGGFEVALACDLIVAGAGARFGLPEVRRGLVAGGGGVLRLPLRLPRSVAMEIVLTGEPISAGRAADLGLVNAVVADGEALVAAVALAERIADGAPLALAAAKRIVNEGASWPRDRAFAIQEELLAPIYDSRDAREGVRAFLERRPPVWRGH